MPHRPSCLGVVHRLVQAFINLGERDFTRGYLVLHPKGLVFFEIAEGYCGPVMALGLFSLLLQSLYIKVVVQ